MTSENPKHPVNPEQTAKDAHTEANQHSSELQQPVAATTKSETKPTPHKYEVACNKKRDWIDKRTLWFEGVGLFVLIVYTIATITYACITYSQWKDLRHNFEADERSWIKLGQEWPPLTTDRVAQMKANLFNVGKSPITQMYAEGAFEIVDSQNAPSFKLNHRRHSTHQGVLTFPNDSSEFGIRLFDQLTKQQRAFTLDEINALQNGTKYAAVFGMIVYSDQFGIHWYRFCAWNPNYGTVMGSANASECVAWNVAGDGKPNVPFEKE